MGGQVQILEEGLFDLSFCLKVGDSKATGKREIIKLSAYGVGWSWENEENMRALG